MLVNLENINKFFNGNQILKNISLTIEDNDRIGLIGNNGCGKSTLLNIITKNIEYDNNTNSESALSVACNKTIGFLKQNSGLDNNRTIKEEMLLTFSHLLDVSKEMRELEKKIAEYSKSGNTTEYEQVSNEYARKLAFFEANEGYLIEVKIYTILNGMGFGDTPTDRLISTLSGGEKTRLALSKLLLDNPDLLILDEPTNHLDFKTLSWLEDYLSSYKGALLIVSHDRYFLNKLCTRICEIERGTLTSFKGDYSAYLVQKKMLVERQLKEYEQQQIQIAELNDYIQKNKVRASTANMAKSREAKLEKIEVLEKPLTHTKQSKIKLEYDIVPPKDVLSVSGLEVKVGEEKDEKELVSSLSFEIRRGEKVAFVGPNGIGKSTILKYILNRIPKTKGSIEWARNVKVSYFEQENLHLNFNNTVLEELHRRFPRETEQNMRDLLAKVMLTGENVFKPVKIISGGERAKLCFAIMMHERGNVLVLDEPTNHLDLATKEILEEALSDYDGTIIFVSHDRYLLNRIASRIIEISKDTVKEFKGNFEFYSQQKKEEEAANQKEAEQAKLNSLKAKTDDNNTKIYRNKEQRASDVKRRNEIKALEVEIDELSERIKVIEEQLLLPEIYSDYQAMTDKCIELENAKTEMTHKYEKWIELSE